MTSNKVKGDGTLFYQALQELLRVYQFRDREGSCYLGLSVTACYALEALTERGPMTVNELAATLHLDKSNASRVVGSLEGRGYVKRTSRPEDGRSWLITATAGGRRHHARIRDRLMAEQKPLIEHLDSATVRTFAKLLRELARTAQERTRAA